VGEVDAVIIINTNYIDFLKVGKLNHNKEIECGIDWPKFRNDVVALLESSGSKYYVKAGLRKAV